MMPLTYEEQEVCHICKKIFVRTNMMKIIKIKEELLEELLIAIAI